MNLFKSSLFKEFTRNSKRSISSLLESVKQEARNKTLNEIQSTQVKQLPMFSTGQFKGSHRKVNHLTRLISGMGLEEARLQMKFSLKKPAVYIEKLLKRIQTHLKQNYDLDPQHFYIKECIVGKGIYRKKLFFHAKGRCAVMKNPKSMVKVKLAQRQVLTQDEQELEYLARELEKTNLFPKQPKRSDIQMAPVWHRHGWKYVTSSKWIHPENAFPKQK